jgi:Ser/Thr protein kinase RdoA (MazF antagonist)
VPISTLSGLETILPLLFLNEHPQVLTHGDFSKTNVLVNPDTYEVTGIADWSLAAVQPFGIELDCLFDDGVHGPNWVAQLRLPGTALGGVLGRILDRIGNQR